MITINFLFDIFRNAAKTNGHLVSLMNDAEKNIRGQSWRLSDGITAWLESRRLVFANTRPKVIPGYRVTRRVSKSSTRVISSISSFLKFLFPRHILA